MIATWLAEILFGLCLGSFAVTAGLRIVRGEQALRGRSHCDHCGVSLGFVQTAPVVAFITQGGVCTSCGERIDVLHIAGEIAGAAILLTSFLAFPPLQAAAISAIGLVLITSAAVDVRSHRLPNRLTLVVAVLALALAMGQGREAVLAGLTAAAAAFVVLQALRMSFRVLGRQEALGFGDVKLVAAMALWLGVATSLAVALAALLGLAAMAMVRPRDGRLAFGPALAFSGWCVGVVTQAQLLPLL